MHNNMFGVSLFNLKQNPVAIASTALSVGSSILSHKEQKKASSQQGQIADLQNRQAEIENAVARKRAIAQNQAIQAQIQANAAASGVSGSSSAPAGETASLGSQLAENIGTQNQQAAITAQEVSLGQSVASHQQKAGTFEAIGQLPGQLGLPTVGSLFAGVGKKVP